MKIKYVNDRPIESIAIEQEAKGIIREKTVNIMTTRDMFQDVVEINYSVSEGAEPYCLRVNWLNAVELRNALTLLIEQTR